LLSIGSALGIASRLTLGWLVDRGGMLPIQRTVWLLATGAAAMGLLATTEPWSYLVALVPAFAGGWAWPGLLNLSVIRNNPSAPASATGITQTGIFLGAGLGPMVGGLVADAGGYRPVWLLCGACLAAASMVAMVLRRRVQAAVVPPAASGGTGLGASGGGAGARPGSGPGVAASPDRTR
jgi:predicted MFS family arabinose efflux permease